MPTFPITATRPSYWVEAHAQDRHGNVFYAGEPVVLPIVDPFIPGTYVDTIGTVTGPSKTPKAFTGHYYVRDYYGDLVASGALAAQTSVSLGSSLLCGWYKVFFTQALTDATYGTAAGSATFVVFPADGRFQTVVGQPVIQPRRTQQSGAHIMRGAMMHGPNRYVFADVATYNIGSPSDLDNIISCLTNELLWYHHPSYQDAARPHRTIVSFVKNAASSPANVTAIVQTLCNTFGANRFWFEGPANEPGGTGAAIATNMQIVYNAVKAGNPNALVIGPCPVSVNNASRPNNAAFMAAAAAMSPVPLDGVSFHFYNCINGDLSMGRAVLDQYVADLTSHGLSGLPRFQTEQGFKTTENGTYMVRFAARWDLQMLLLFDQYNLPKEHCHVWYDRSMGFWGVPHFWHLADYTPLPPVPMLRQLSAELLGKTYASKLDFGSPGNDMMLGNRYHDAATGDDVIALQAAGSTDHDLDFVVHGTGSLVLADCFGNTSSVAVSANTVTVAVALEPVYLRVPSGVTCRLVRKWNYAQDIATVTKATSSGSPTNQTANIARVVNGIQEDGYAYNVASTRNNVHSPYFDDTNSFPAWLTVTWPRPTSVDRVIVFASPPWQAQGTLVDFDVQTWDGAAWVTKQTFTEPIVESTVDDAAAVVFPFVDYQDQGGCQHVSFFSDRWIFEASFAQVTTTAVRVYVRNATYGMPPTLNCWTDQAGDKGTFGNNFVIREVTAFCTDLAVPRIVMAPT